MSATPPPAPDRRKAPERRKAMVILEATDAYALMREAQYTGSFIGHMHDGVLKRIEIPNPAGWFDRT